MTKEQPLSSQVGYEIRIGGVLDERWSDWFSGLEVLVEEPEKGSRVTTLTGALDSSALHGILARIRDLNLKLISVTQLLRPDANPQTQQGGK